MAMLPGAMCNSPALPPTRAVLTRLIDSISQSPQPQSTAGNPLQDAPIQTRRLLLTLHVLFPNEFLPALDLLDRNLVTRLSIRPQAAAENNPAHPLAAATQQTFIYIVRSAQHRPTHPHSRRSGFDTSPPAYHVLLTAWHCSCPAFAFAAFPPHLDSNAPIQYEDSEELLSRHDPDTAESRHGENQHWSFGGLSRAQSSDALPPVCKHLLACVLVERCRLFEQHVERRDASPEEVAGWAAGWGG